MLALVAAGRDVPVALERALAATVLDRPESRLAMRALAGGGYALQATLELAALVLGQVRSDEKRGVAS